MAACNIEEGDIKMFGQSCVQMVFTRQTNMVDIDIDAVGISGPEGQGHPNATRGAEREKKIPYIRSETEKSKKPEICPKGRGPRRDSNARGHEQGIGPDNQRTGRHEARDIKLR
jgi:hypothetical protein